MLSLLATHRQRLRLGQVKVALLRVRRIQLHFGFPLATQFARTGSRRPIRRGGNQVSFARRIGATRRNMLAGAGHIGITRIVSRLPLSRLLPHCCPAGAWRRNLHLDAIGARERPVAGLKLITAVDDAGRRRWTALSFGRQENDRPLGDRSLLDRDRSSDFQAKWRRFTATRNQCKSEATSDEGPRQRTSR